MKYTEDNKYMWKKCPQCKGSGIMSYGICDVCLGHKIINRLTGRPPHDGKTFPHLKTK